MILTKSDGWKVLESLEGLRFEGLNDGRTWGVWRGFHHAPRKMFESLCVTNSRRRLTPHADLRPIQNVDDRAIMLHDDFSLGLIGARDIL